MEKCVSDTGCNRSVGGRCFKMRWRVPASSLAWNTVRYIVGSASGTLQPKLDQGASRSSGG